MNSNLPFLPFIGGLEQVAIATHEPTTLQANMRQQLGLDEWAEDIVSARGWVFDQPAENTAHLLFNHQLGFELELIQYLEGDNWLAHRYGSHGQDYPAHLSHMGRHVADMEAEKRKRLSAGWRIAQEVMTYKHTNPYLNAMGRTYHYVVWDTYALFGYDLKMIQRIQR